MNACTYHLGPRANNKLKPEGIPTYVSIQHVPTESPQNKNHLFEEMTYILDIYNIAWQWDSSPVSFRRNMLITSWTVIRNIPSPESLGNHSRTSRPLYSQTLMKSTRERKATIQMPRVLLNICLIAPNQSIVAFKFTLNQYLTAIVTCPWWIWLQAFGEVA